ncbi:hypothetical protein [Nocardioides pacificus]
MTTAWVAGVVRAKALARRRIGAGAARAVATAPSLDHAVAALVASPYGHDVRVGQTLAEAQHAVGASLLWDMRVLAGWLPRSGAQVVRLLAAGFELANLAERLSTLEGGPAEPAYSLGALDTAWARLSTTSTPGAAAEVLGASPWRLRGLTTRRELWLGTRLAWADSVVAGVPEAAAWARGGAALLVLREIALEGRGLSPALARRASYVLGPGLLEAMSGPRTDLSVVRAALPGDTRWVLEGVGGVEELWSAEGRWWLRVERDAFALLTRSGYDQGPVVGAIAVLAADAWRVRAALEIAARGGTAAAMEAFDAMA